VVFGLLSGMALTLLTKRPLQKFTLLLLSSFILFSSCAVFRKAQPPAKDLSITSAITSFDSVGFVLKNMISHYPQFEWFSAKTSVAFSTPDKDLSFKAFIRIRKDSAIWVSAAMGIEGARLLFTKDSVKLIDRINNRYYLGNYSYFDTILNLKLDYNILQAMLTTNMNQFLPDSAKEYSLSHSDSSYFLTYLSKSNSTLNNGVETRIQLLKSQYYLLGLWGDDETQKQSLYLLYNNHQLVNDQFFPFQVNAEIKAVETSNLSLEFEKIEINKPLEFPFKIPANYTALFK
jgi:hypothetical protein